MESYRIGKGPSLHTITPEHACKIFRVENPDADSFEVVLYGSLVKTSRELKDVYRERAEGDLAE